MSDILKVATTGITTAQQALDTIAHNIANVNTPGYSRQVTHQTAHPPVPFGGFFQGSGVGVTGIERVVSQFLVESLRDSQASLSAAEAFNQIANDIDTILAEPSMGLSQSLTAFFNALHEVVGDSESIPARQLLITQAQGLQTTFNQLDQYINDAYKHISYQITENVRQANVYAEQIAQLNLQIKNLSKSNTVPNDLLDQREQALQNLSQFINISTTMDSDGGINVFIGSGQSFVMNTTVRKLTVQPSDFDSRQVDVQLMTGKTKQSVTQNIQKGTIGGMLAAYQSIIHPAQNSLGAIAISLAEAMNSQHQLGIDLSGCLGKNLFNDPNDFSEQLNRVWYGADNTGNATFAVAVNSASKSQTIFSESSGLVNAGTLPGVGVGTLVINGITIKPSQAGDDINSTSDQAASAIALAQAINDSTGAHHVYAEPQQNVINLGQFTAGALAAGNLAINGVNIVSTGNDIQTLLDDINALSIQTGVKAVNDSSSNILLVAKDGRNIQLTKTIDSAGASLSHLNLAHGGAFDLVQRANIKLSADEDATIEIGGNGLVNIGLSESTATTVGITTDDFMIKFDGLNYQLFRLSDKKLLMQSAVPNFDIGGVSISLQSGIAQAQDIFYIKPAVNGAKNFELAIKDPKALALASPLEISGHLSNLGSAQASISSMHATGVTATSLGFAVTEDKQMAPPFLIEFTSPTSYQIYDYSNNRRGDMIGPEQYFDLNQSVHTIFPISGVIDPNKPNEPPMIFDPGFQVTITGEPQINDIFTINYNQNAVSDNRNAVQLAQLQFEKLCQGNTTTLQDSYVELIGYIGSLDSQSMLRVSAAQNSFEAMISSRNQISGVNLDEEAALLMQYQQVYQACAQVIATSRSVFDTLIRIFGG